jgi:LacI family transcriptional regulator, galactose operon repressor
MARGDGRATIGDVARKARVSQATVSRVMNGLDTVDPALAAKVMEAAAALRYEPSRLARGLALGRTHTVALVVPDLENPMFQGALRGLSRAAGEDGYRVLVADSAENVEEEAILAQEARRRCDALVLCAPRMPEEQLVALLPALAPAVLLNRDVPVDPIPVVSVDYAAGITDLLTHLHSLGHRRVAYLAGPTSSAANGERLAGLHRRAGALREVEIQEIACGAMFDDGHAAVPNVLDTDVTAVMAFNDVVALGFLGGCHDRGVEVPGRLSVTGFDDIPVARYMYPPLTTASVPLEKLGRIAWRRLRALLRDETPDHDVLFRPRLTVRASTAAPR